MQCISSLLDEESRLRHFQESTLAEADEEWYKLVPETAQQVLGKEEVLRQSVIFELIKSEREYVRDLESMKLVFIRNLRDYSPIPAKRLEGFITQVFCNVDDVLRFHQQMLANLFERQREQHPLIQSIADIVLSGESHTALYCISYRILPSATVEFGPAYEKYILDARQKTRVMTHSAQKVEAYNTWKKREAQRIKDDAKDIVFDSEGYYGVLSVRGQS